MVQATQVDERSDQWISSNPAFRVMLFAHDSDVSWAVDTWEISGCGVLDAIRWVQDHVQPAAPGRSGCSTPSQFPRPER
ncbi:MAG: hypothetical protein JWQ32_3210 [Marmoricola sp.]|nr:hypothetical protein [Marmoricola sp.]